MRVHTSSRKTLRTGAPTLRPGPRFPAGLALPSKADHNQMRLIQTINNLNWTWRDPEPRVLGRVRKSRTTKGEESSVPEDVGLRG